LGILPNQHRFGESLACLSETQLGCLASVLVGYISSNRK
jgi:hypothetical protein